MSMMDWSLSLHLRSKSHQQEHRPPLRKWPSFAQAPVKFQGSTAANTTRSSSQRIYEYRHSRGQPAYGEDSWYSMVCWVGHRSVQDCAKRETLSSVYDPLGFVAPFILKGKQILQEMCMNQLDWDSPIPESLQPQWRQWIAEVKSLDSVVIKRCLKPIDFDEVVTAEIHHFSDASTLGYGQCSYLRLIDRNQRVHCSLIMAKARVTPIKLVTIPWLELMAALVSVRISTVLLEELDISNVVEWFWTDSSVVLSYIRNEARRFHVFVANRVQQIRDHKDPSQWNYICSANNPADLASRGATPKELMDKKMWFNGPDFLW